jgi:membrane associated rhomboid family serine protease
MTQYYYRQVNVRFGPGGLTPMIRNLLIANGAVFALQLLFYYMPVNGDRAFLDHLFGLNPGDYIKNLYQVVTYMFLHSIQAPLHIAFNMFFLWMFGVDVEKRLGSRSFAWMYFISGIGAGVVSCVFFIIKGSLDPGGGVVVIGASGAVFGVMLAYGLLFPDRMILLFFILPIKALYMVMFMIGVEVLYMATRSTDGVAHVTHVTGALFAYIYLLNEKAFMKAAPRADAIQRVREKIETISEAEEQRRIDDILDKINREGMHKLSRNERAFLRRRAAKRRQD